MVDEDAIFRQMAANEELHAQGKLSYPAMCAKNEALQAQLQAACTHAKTEKDDLGDGDFILWCANDTCGVMVQKHVKDKEKARLAGTPGKTTKKKGGWGCVVLGLALAGGVSALVWWAAEGIGTVL